MTSERHLSFASARRRKAHRQECPHFSFSFSARSFLRHAGEPYARPVTNRLLACGNGRRCLSRSPNCGARQVAVAVYVSSASMSFRVRVAMATSLHDCGDEAMTVTRFTPRLFFGSQAFKDSIRDLAKIRKRRARLG